MTGTSEGRIVEVLERGRETFVGVLQKQGGNWFVEPDGNWASDAVLIRDPHAKNAKVGDKVAIELLHYPSERYVPEGVITEVLGPGGFPIASHSTETEADANIGILAVHPLRIAADQVVPVRQVPAEGDQTISAGRGQPVEPADVLRRNLRAVRDVALAVRVVRAAVAAEVEKAAGDVGERGLPAVLVLDPDLAAEAAAVAERFPLLRAHLLQGLFLPEDHAWDRLVSRPAPRRGGAPPRPLPDRGLDLGPNRGPDLAAAKRPPSAPPASRCRRRRPS